MFVFIGFASILYILAEKKNAQQISFKHAFLDQLQYVVSIFTLKGTFLIINNIYTAYITTSFYINPCIMKGTTLSQRTILVIDCQCEFWSVLGS